MLELDADADEGPPRIERLAEHTEQRGALLEQLEQPLIGLELVALGGREQAGGAAHVQARAPREQLREGRAERREEGGRPLREARILEPLSQRMRARLQAGDRF